MQTIHESILRAVNNDNASYNFLTAPTHEAYQSNWSSMPHMFYMLQHQSFKSWNSDFRQIPKNHILLDSPLDFNTKIDIVLSQNKFGQYGILKQHADNFNVPFISLEHTLPYPEWTKWQLADLRQMRGDVDVFISEYSVQQWGFELDDPKVKVIHHGIDTELFHPSGSEKTGKILAVCNDYINRDWCCGWSIFQNVVLNNSLPFKILGATQGLSEPAKDVQDLVEHYQKSSVFFNTSTISPVPTSLMEAMSCGTPVLSTATCMIPEIIQNGENGFCSNDQDYLLDRLKWCLANPNEAQEIGRAGRETILKKFHLKTHINKWLNLFDSIYGTLHDQWNLNNAYFL